MTRAFIVKVQIGDLSVPLVELAEDIDDDLTAAGHDVESVVPFADTPSTGLGAGFILPAPTTSPEPPNLFS